MTIFPVGVHDMHPDESLDFQLNRLASLGGGDREELIEVAPRIADLDDWKREFLALAERAVADGRIGHGGAYYRAAEFNMAHGDPDKPLAYQHQLDLHAMQYANEYKAGTVETGKAPASGYEIPYWRFNLSSAESSGTIVVHGGFDSYGEELYPIGQELAKRGFDTIVFEGPGQGAVIRQQGIPFTRDWHEPVGAVLDHLQLTDVTLIGLSLGGCLAPRAAAEDARISRVVAWGIMWDMFDVTASALPDDARPVFEKLVDDGEDDVLDSILEARMAESLLTKWALEHGMYVLGVDRPSGYVHATRGLTTRDISTQITQDVLLLTGTADHYVPMRHLYEQAAALTNARSITARVFTEAEHAHTHCQVGNMPLAIDTIAGWTDERTTAKR